MNEKESDPKTGAKDRRLGDQWLDWNGTASSEEDRIDEKLSTFLGLAAGSVLIVVACLCVGWYLTKPRIDQASSLLSNLIEWSALVLGCRLFCPGRPGERAPPEIRYISFPLRMDRKAPVVPSLEQHVAREKARHKQGQGWQLLH